MSQIETVRMREEWAEGAVVRHGGVTAFAEAIRMHVSTVSRQLAGKSEASPRFIGAVMTYECVSFQDAFVVTVEEVAKRRARIVKRPTGKRIAQTDQAVA